MKALAGLLGVLALLAAAPDAQAQSTGLTWRLDIPRPEKGCEFPDFSLPDTSGTMVSFKEFGGKPILLAFCSCYTDTCCPILARLEELRAKYAGKVVVILVCCETAPALAKDSFRKLEEQCRGSADRVLIDDGWQTRIPFLVSALPTTYLIDPSFCMRFKAVTVADLNTPEFAAELERVLAPGP